MPARRALPIRKAGRASSSLSQTIYLQLLLGMTGDGLVLDLVVGGLGENAASDELVLRSIRTAVDDSLGVSVADAGKCFELVGGGGVDIERSYRRGRRLGRLGDIEDRGNCE